MKYLATSAEISLCEKYRYSLHRRLAMGERSILFVGLNPSTADQNQDDPTIRRCARFAREWGFDWLMMGNVYAYRSTDPKKLYKVDDPIGPENWLHLKWMAQKSEIVVAAWGKNKLHSHGQDIATWVLSLPHVKCLGQNLDWTPKHPLYLAATTELRPWSRSSPR